MTRALVLAAILLALGACGREGAETDGENVTFDIAAALDPCAEDAGPADRALCGDEKLAALDARIRSAMVREAGEISEEGRRTIVENHQRWLRAQRTACGIIDADAAPTPDQAACLEAALTERVRESERAVEREGPYTFQRMEMISAQAVTAEAAAASGMGEGAPTSITRDIRFPRIDDASTPQAARFNDIVSRIPESRFEPGEEVQVDYQIAFAGPDLISVRFDSYSYAMGAAHPNNSTRAVTVVMTTGKPLEVGDVFRAGSGWEDFLTQRAVRALTERFREENFTPPETDVRDSVAKPHLWLIKEEGLTLLFPPYSFGGPHVLGGAEVTIPWADLARYLNPNAPAPIRAPA
ncbi:MAG: DUF3298 domain-containing protein [Hydrogenophilaceae bacterium]|nr:DUF3298 domain-containing protein [Hydrogenophilaceae bacterium]